MEMINNQVGLYCRSMYSQEHIYTLKQIKQLIKQAMKIYNANEYIDKIYLFGSYARNNASASSDIDLMIETEENLGLQFFGLYVLFEEIFNKSVDIVIRDSENISEGLKKNIEKEKVLVYER